MKRLLLVALLLLPLAGCGSDGGDDVAAPAAVVPTTAAATAATTATSSVKVGATVGGETTLYQLDCDPAGGDHPNPAAACAALLEAFGQGVLDPPPADQVCTEVEGGPEIATVVGTVQGKAVNRELDRRDGCGISDWKDMGAVLPARS